MQGAPVAHFEASPLSVPRGHASTLILPARLVPSPFKPPLLLTNALENRALYMLQMRGLSCVPTSLYGKQALCFRVQSFHPWVRNPQYCSCPKLHDPSHLTQPEDRVLYKLQYVDALTP